MRNYDNDPQQQTSHVRGTVKRFKNKVTGQFEYIANNKNGNMMHFKHEHLAKKHAESSDDELE